MASFLQSPEWQEIQERSGRQTARINEILAVRHQTRMLSFLYVPRPDPPPDGFFAELSRSALGRNAAFVRVDPALPFPPPAGMIAPAPSLQAPQTLLVSCTLGDEALRSGMRPKTRYNIGLAIRHGVVVRAISRPNSEELGRLMPVLSGTAARGGFRLHPARHYRNLFEVRSKRFSNELFLADYRGRILAAAIVNFYQPSAVATYLHGGSLDAERRVMAPSLLFWTILCASRERGMRSFDFGGIDPARWPGLTRFKQGFGGAAHTWPSSYDWVLRPMPWAAYRTANAARRFLRRGQEP